MQHTLILKKYFSYYPSILLSLCAFFLFYKYILQIFPSIIADELMQEFKLSGMGLGHLAATFYYSYMLTQFVVGIILDKYSTRWFTTCAILSCSVGAVLFSQAHTLMSASVARAIMGIGVAFATVTYMKTAALWFLPRQYAFVSGLLASAAMLGAVFGETPIAWLVEQLGWRDCIFKIGIIGIAFAMLYGVIARDKKNQARSPGALTPHDIKNVFKSKQNWLLACYSGLAFSPVAVFGGLWGNPFLQKAYSLSKTEVAFFVSLIFIGLAVGSPIIGYLSDRLDERKWVMFYCMLIGCFILCLIIYCEDLPLPLLGGLLFSFGFCLGSFMLVFVFAKEINHLSVTATVIAMINGSDAVIDSFTEPAIGKILDLTWDGLILKGMPSFSIHNYQMALTILPIYLLLSAIILWFVKDTKLIANPTNNH